MLSTLNAQDIIINTGDEWEYYDKEKPLPPDWFLDNGINRKWEKGVSPLGYGDDVIATIISYGEDSSNKHITKYFRKTFTMNNLYSHLIYKLSVQRDDGIVVYLNGKEVMRNNMPDGVITHSTKASSLVHSSTVESLTYSKLLSPDDFIVGANTISVSVHQARAESSDCIFNLKLTGSDDPEMIPLLLKEQTIKNLNLDIKIRELDHVQEIEKKNLELEFTKQSKNSYKTLFFILLTLLLSLIALLFYLWQNFSKKENFFAKELDTFKEKILSKDRQMMNVSLSSLNDKQFLKEVKRKLETHTDKTNATISKKDIELVIKQMDYNLGHEEEWENLKRHFNAVHAGYVDRLTKLHPSLTDVEVRHCIFMKLHMQTKEIANILHIDPRSVQASRYRLKKKMNLDEGTDLRTYVQSI